MIKKKVHLGGEKGLGVRGKIDRDNQKKRNSGMTRVKKSGGGGESGLCRIKYGGKVRSKLCPGKICSGRRGKKDSLPPPGRRNGGGERGEGAASFSARKKEGSSDHFLGETGGGVRKKKKSSSRFGA